MGTENIRCKAVLPASPKRIYDAWMDGKEHGNFTGGNTATIDPKVGGKFTAWDGYIEGTTLELEEGRRIVQSWRSSEFPPGAPDSRVEVQLSPGHAGTEILVLHSNIPAGQGKSYETGWVDHYFVPMKKYFQAQGDAAGYIVKESPAKSAAAYMNRDTDPTAYSKPNLDTDPSRYAAPEKKAAARAKPKGKVKAAPKKKAAPAKKKVAAKKKPAAKKTVAAKKKPAMKKTKR